MKNGSYSATTVAGSTALPFVISTGEVMGRGPAQGDQKRLSSNYSRCKRRPPLCHLDRSSVPGFPTSRCSRRPRVRLSLKRAACDQSTPLFSTGSPGEERSGEICGSGPFLEMSFGIAPWKPNQFELRLELCITSTARPSRPSFLFDTS